MDDRKVNERTRRKSQPLHSAVDFINPRSEQKEKRSLVAEAREAAASVTIQHCASSSQKFAKSSTFRYVRHVTGPRYEGSLPFHNRFE